MSPEINLLITLTNGEELFRVAIKIDANDIGDIMPYYLEPENQARLHKMLPLHCQSLGKIVEVEEIFEIKYYK